MKVTSKSQPTQTGSDAPGGEKIVGVPADSSADALAVAGIPPEELTPKIQSTLSSLLREVAALRQELQTSKVRIGELEALADSDPLLGILNRRAFVVELNRAIALVTRHNITCSLLFIDLDGLKVINDTFGHAGGDIALKETTAALSRQIRQTDFLGRLGGDELAILLTHTNIGRAEDKATALKQSVAALRVEVATQLLPLSVSIGVVEITPDMTAEMALESADQLMYQQKSPVPKR